MKGCMLSSLLAVAVAHQPSVNAVKLQPPLQGPIAVAFVVTEGATVIDFAGPWEVFDNVMVENRMAFQLYTVSDTKDPIRASGGLRIVPDYTFDDAPSPRVVVIGAQSGKSPKMIDWMRRMTERADVVMSVCTGAFKLALTGALDGKPATTHHEFTDVLQKQFPRVRVERGKRFVRSDDRIFTGGGLTSGIDLALHVVDLYFGHDVAAKTATYLEHEGKGWWPNDAGQRDD